MAAFGVPKMDTVAGKRSDPYLSVALVDGGGRVLDQRQTAFVMNTMNPVWQETLVLHLPAGERWPPMLRISLWDKDFRSADDHIGTTEIALSGGNGGLDGLVSRYPMESPVKSGMTASFRYHCSQPLFEGAGK